MVSLRSRTLAAALLLPALLAGCGSPPETARPNVLLIVVDTMRADHLAAYGGSRPVPAIDALAAEGVTVAGLRACTSWTMPSMATLFTGLSPAEHQVMRMRGPGSHLLDIDTLAARFAAAGYRTGCIMSNFLLLGDRGFEHGFERYDDQLARSPEPHRGSTAAQVATRGLNWLDESAANAAPAAPWFLTLHFFDPHTSYEDHPEWSFTDPAYRGWVRGGLDDAAYKQHEAAATAADRAQLAALYDEEIQAVGAALGRVRTALESRGDWDNTLVILTADHGEELAERGYIGHTRTLHFEQVNLPWIIRFPGQELAGTRRVGLVAQEQLFATILDLAELPCDKPAAGESVAAWLRGSAPGSPSAWVYFEVDFEPVKADPERRVLLRGVEQRDAAGRLIGKLVRDRKRGTDQLWTEPAERVDRSSDPAAAALLADLQARLAAHTWYTP